MKCVKNVETGNISRVVNERAFILVYKNKTHTFCSKKEWKETVRDINKKVLT
jgi:hypothetical protein